MGTATTGNRVGLLTSMRRDLRERVRQWAWKVLVRVDDSFGQNARALAPAALPVPLPVPLPVSPGVDAPAPAAPAPVRGPRTIVVNEGAILANVEMVSLLLDSILPGDRFTALRADLLDHLRAHPEAWSRDELVAGELRAALLARLDAKAGDDGRLVSAAIESLYAHEADVRVAREAYSPKGKLNPDAGFWPDPTYEKHPRSIWDEVPFARRRPLIAKDTPIGSAGSCFAWEIAHRLQKEGFRYLITEPHVNPSNGLSNSCARWGILFNTPSFRQLVERAFGVRDLPRLLWTANENGPDGARKTVYLDPFREDIAYDSIEEYEADLPRHIAKAREALLGAKVFVITLGLNEVWELKSDGSVLQRSPWRVASSLVRPRVLTVEENVAELQRMLDVWRRFNPSLELIVSVSPVPLHATFRADSTHVVEANCHSKAVLRVAAEAFAARNRGVHYFPSYEVVTACVRDAWEKDQRHVTRPAVDRVMELFGRMFRADAAAG